MPPKKIARTHRVAVKLKPSEPVASSAQGIPLRLYRRLAVAFVGLVTLALVAVLYLSTAQAIIRVRAVPKAVFADFIVRTVETATTDGEVQGVVYTGTLGKTKTFPLSGDAQKEISEQATGRVIITNTTSSPQPLVATTRFLSAQGVLFRLKNGVTVPANGNVEAQVFADQKGTSGNIEPTTFTIPGLNEVKQKLITASSSATFAGGVRIVSVLTQADVDRAVASLNEELTKDAEAMFREGRKVMHNGKAFFLDAQEQKINARVGDEVSAFDLTLTVLVSGVFYDDEALKKITKRKLYEGLGQGQTFLNEGEGERRVIVENVNAQKTAASIHVIQTGTAIPSRTHKAFDVARFVGMRKEDVRALLLNEGVATQVEVQCFPFWVKTIPRLKDRIEVEIQSP